MRTMFGAILTGLVLVLAGPARADDQAELKAFIDKAVKAAGGEANLAKYRASAWKAKGKIHVMGASLDYTGEWHEFDDAKARFSIDLDVMGQQIRQTNVVNGDKGWIKISVGGMDVMNDQMTKEMLDEAKEEFHHGRILSLRAFALKDKDLELSPVGEVKVNDKPCLGIRVTKNGRRDVSLFFDKETHLLLKAQMRVKDFTVGGNEVDQEFLFSDYKDFGGLKQAVKFVMNRDGKPFLDAEVTEYKHEEKLDDSLFQKP